MVTQTVMNMKLCIQKNSWNQISSTKKYRILREDESYGDWKYTFNRNVDTSKKHDYDCLYNERIKVRPVPIDCYGDFDQWTMKVSIYKFISEIINDLRFTYDFVLHEENPNQFAKENMLWYNIMYLRTLLINIPNPITVIEAINNVASLTNTMNRIISDIDNLKNQIVKLQDILKTLNKSHDDIKSKLSAFTLQQSGSGTQHQHIYLGTNIKNDNYASTNNSVSTTLRNYDFTVIPEFDNKTQI